MLECDIFKKFYSRVKYRLGIPRWAPFIISNLGYSAPIMWGKALLRLHCEGWREHILEILVPK